MEKWKYDSVGIFIAPVRALHVIDMLNGTRALCQRILRMVLNTISTIANLNYTAVSEMDKYSCLAECITATLGRTHELFE